MKALSVRQPWASLIANGSKTVEIRTWTTPYRGPLLICAAKTKAPPDMPVGIAMAVVDLIDIRPASHDDVPSACCDICDGDMAWILSSPRLVPPVPVSGKLGIFEATIETA